MSPLGLILTAILSVVVFTGSRRHAVLGVFAAVCYVIQSQQVNIAGFHFTAMRMVLLVGFVRLWVRGEFRGVKLNRIDKVVLIYPVLSTVLSTMRNGELFVYQLGITYDVLLSYFVIRGLVKDWDDTKYIVRGLACLIVPLALLMMWESIAGNNLFKLMGEHVGGQMREGRYRCVGAFRGPHTVGTLGGTLMPIFVGLYFTDRRYRSVAVIGILAATVLTYTSNSSGPLMSYASSLVALAFWKLRTDMKMVRNVMVVSFVGLSILMKAPIWYLIARISTLTGGHGWHRAYLMDQCSKHISDWWLMGTDDTSEWAVTLMAWGGADITNQYVSCAANAGLAALTLFILILLRCFEGLGSALRVARESMPGAEPLLWGVGCALSSHVIAILSVTYWDQMYVAWWGLLAIIASATTYVQGRGESSESGVGNSCESFVAGRR